MWPDATAVAYTKDLQSLFTFMNEIHYFFSMVVKQWGGIRQTDLILCYYSSGDLLIFLNIKFLEE